MIDRTNMLTSHQPSQATLSPHFLTSRSAVPDVPVTAAKKAKERIATSSKTRMLGSCPASLAWPSLPEGDGSCGSGGLRLHRATAVRMGEVCMGPDGLVR